MKRNHLWQNERKVKAKGETDDIQDFQQRRGIVFDRCIQSQASERLYFVRLLNEIDSFRRQPFSHNYCATHAIAKDVIQFNLQLLIRHELQETSECTLCKAEIPFKASVMQLVRETEPQDILRIVEGKDIVSVSRTSKWLAMGTFCELCLAWLQKYAKKSSDIVRELPVHVTLCEESIGAKDLCHLIAQYSFDFPQFCPCCQDAKFDPLADLRRSFCDCKSHSSCKGDKSCLETLSRGFGPYRRHRCKFQCQPFRCDTCNLQCNSEVPFDNQRRSCMDCGASNWSEQLSWSESKAPFPRAPGYCWWCKFPLSIAVIYSPRYHLSCYEALLPKDDGGILDEPIPCEYCG